MSTKQVLLPLFTVAVAVLGFAAATSAHASEAGYENPAPLHSTLTRAEVRGDAVRALASGEYTQKHARRWSPKHARRLAWACSAMATRP
jgi:hypothetical protein